MNEIYYPEIHFPDRILDILNKSQFARSKKPLKPIPPNEESSWLHKSIMFGVWIVLVGNLAIYGIIIGIALSIFIHLKRKKIYQNKLSDYQSKMSVYRKELDTFKLESQMTDEEHNLFQRNKQLKRELSRASHPFEYEDHKKGATHSYFMTYLQNMFDDNIVDDVTLENNFLNSVKSRYHFRHDDYSEERKRYYVPDFVFCDFENNIFVAIEIDEPYTLGELEAIHFDDSKRNQFFLKNYWTIVRFAEEQIVKYPEECCALVLGVVNSIKGKINTREMNSQRSNIPNVEKWTEESVNSLIKSNYRRNILSLMSK